MSRLRLANRGGGAPIWRERDARNVRGNDEGMRFLVYDKAICHAREFAGEFAEVKRRLGCESCEHKKCLFEYPLTFVRDYMYPI